MTEPTRIVREFCDLMERRDPELLRAYLADDATYQNCGMPPIVGVNAILENLGHQFARHPDSYAYETLNISADGHTVLTERLDYLSAPDGTVVGIPVMGTFVLTDHRIMRWTDYWDTMLPRRIKDGEDISGLVPSQY